MQLFNARERWTFRLAPLSTVMVWWGLTAAGNRGWLDGFSAEKPQYIVTAATLLTWLAGLVTMPLVRRCYRRWQGNDTYVGLRLFLLSVALGTLWGGVMTLIGSGFALAGPLCGAVTGLVLVSALPASSGGPAAMPPSAK